MLMDDDLPAIRAFKHARLVQFEDMQMDDPAAAVSEELLDYAPDSAANMDSCRAELTAGCIE